MAIKATFSGAILNVLGDAQNNTVTLGQDPTGMLLVNAGAVPIQGGIATVFNTSLIQAFGQAGDDTITLDESIGLMPSADLFGGAGNDTLVGGSANDLLFGQAGNDRLLGKGGSDQLFGRDGNDILTGGDGDGQMFGEAGNERVIWN